MPLLDFLLKLFRLRHETEPQKYASDVSLYPALDLMAEQQQRSPDEVISSLVASGLAQQSEQQELIQRWYLLTPREQDVAALACLGYSNPEIASILNVTRETVKSHMSNALGKFGFSTRAELKVMLRGWDFSAWNPHP